MATVVVYIQASISLVRAVELYAWWEMPAVMICLAPIWTEKHETAKRSAQCIKVLPGVARSKGFRSGENPVALVEEALVPPSRAQERVSRAPCPAQMLETLDPLKALKSDFGIKAQRHNYPLSNMAMLLRLMGCKGQVIDLRCVLRKGRPCGRSRRLN
ncbi:hypothetical protein ABMC88_10140 [Sulfitobacter sp. HNIBRBA2951]|uniref:hypothetical protein n=1 Tax=Sulfitobacter aquimarinus TaxID=3158557 RepID=UPI0032DE4323